MLQTSRWYQPLSALGFEFKNLSPQGKEKGNLSLMIFSVCTHNDRPLPLTYCISVALHSEAQKIPIEILNFYRFTAFYFSLFLCAILMIDRKDTLSQLGSQHFQLWTTPTFVTRVLCLFLPEGDLLL